MIAARCPDLSFIFLSSGFSFMKGCSFSCVSFFAGEQKIEDKRNRTFAHSSLPAAAWYFLCIVCHFCAPQGAKMTHKALNSITIRTNGSMVRLKLPARTFERLRQCSERI